MTCVGAKRGLFDDTRDQVFASPPSAKRTRSAVISPSHAAFGQNFQHQHQHSQFTSPQRIHHSHLLAQLRAHFPEMDPQVVEETLDNAEHNLEAAIKCLEGLRLSAKEQQQQQQQQAEATENSARTTEEEAPRPAPTAEASAEETLGMCSDTMVQEMAGATGLPDARSKSLNLLRRFEAEVARRVTAVAAVENGALKDHISALARDNIILKRAVAIQNQRQQEHAGREQEMVQMQQTVLQYQEQLRNAEMHNYALSMHLRQAAGASSSGLHGNHNPDIC